MTAKVLTFKAGTSLPPEGGRTLSDSRNPQQSKAWPTRTCSNSTERCVNLPVAHGENTGTMDTIRSRGGH